MANGGKAADRVRRTFGLATDMRRRIQFELLKYEIGIDGLPIKPLVVIKKNEIILWDSMYGEVRAIEEHTK